MDSFLRKLVDRFPDNAQLIIEQARASADFRAVCEEIDIAESAVLRWKNLPARAAEYNEILDSLHSEFWKCLTDSKGNRSLSAGAALEGEIRREKL